MNTKNKTKQLLILLLLTFILGCKQLAINPKTIHFDPEENLTTFEITHKGNTDTKIAITINPSKPWLEVTPNEAILGKNDKISVQVYLNRLYSHTEKEYPEYATANINIKSFFESYSLPITTAPNYFTEIFDKNIDLAYKSLSFMPDNSLNFYKLTTNDIKDFPTKSEEQNIINFPLFKNLYKLSIADGKKVLFYGQSYDTLYISYSGWIEFQNSELSSKTKCGKNITELERHFYSPRISMFPINNINNIGTISYVQLQNRIVISYENVPTYQNENNEVKNTFQIEFYFTGKININYLNVDTNATGVIGLSYGTGDYITPPGFLPSDLVSSSH